MLAILIIVLVLLLLLGGGFGYSRRGRRGYSHRRSPALPVGRPADRSGPSSRVAPLLAARHGGLPRRGRAHHGLLLRHRPRHGGAPRRARLHGLRLGIVMSLTAPSLRRASRPLPRRRRARTSPRSRSGRLASRCGSVCRLMPNSSWSAKRCSLMRQRLALPRPPIRMRRTLPAASRGAPAASLRPRRPRRARAGRVV